MNVKSVFLYEDLDEKIYMKLSDDYRAENDVVYKLQKFIYDLKQASWIWATVLQEFLVKHDLWRLKADYCVYTNDNLIVLIYVDNLLIINKGSDFKALLNLKKKLNKQFKMTDLDLAKCYLDIKITHLSDRLLLTQIIFIDEILEWFDIKDSASKSMLMIPGLQLDSDLADNPLNDMNTEYYQQMIESLLYLALDMWSDIA